ncbi:S8 family peptidase [Streptomyces sp. A3M-1-3]|uniref:S8 family peptidase n=1 Tax=Streptomyces sp. A3M-1-3 TaxID=2962044 RepID=UPI0020B88F9B|nr:S8 family peptidase [Streptomyces sp. A3M-1-3]MCP3816772.1 S8 family peptidase [Streptomyces sp. A3M-1-3]
MRLLALATAVTAALVTAGPLSASAHSAATGQAASGGSGPAPLHRSANALPGRYIVTLSATADAEEMVGRLGVKSQFMYKSVVRGFAAALTPPQLHSVRWTPGVEAVEEDAEVFAPKPDGGTRVPASSWGLDRLDQRSLPLDSQFTVKGTGRGATAYIIDTGIDYSHSEFGGRAQFGYDAIGDGRRGQDCHGHGTHVAGTVGGATYGVAREATLVSVRVLDCQGAGSLSGVIAGFDWVADNAVQPSVLNASLGGPRSIAVNNAANAVSDRGVLPVVAAGNESADACDVSPASASRVVTVGASDSQDQQTAFSNYGECLSLYAPGASIVSAQRGGGSVALDGTSMASPHVAGTALLYKAAYQNAGPATVASWLVAQSTKAVLTNVGEGSPNSLLYSGDL